MAKNAELELEPEPEPVDALPSRAVAIPQTDEERRALRAELAAAPPKPVELMAPEERAAHYIRRRQMRLALAGRPDDTTPDAREIARCCG